MNNPFFIQSNVDSCNIFSNCFFITADVSVRLDPFFFLGQAVQSGQRQFVYELSMLQRVAERLNKKENS